MPGYIVCDPIKPFILNLVGKRRRYFIFQRKIYTKSPRQRSQNGRYENKCGRFVLHNL